VPVVYEARHLGKLHAISVACELPTHGVAEGGVMRKEAGFVLYPPHEFLLVGELNIGEGCVFCVERKIRFV
jgi:hypothetical protein